MKTDTTKAELIELAKQLGLNLRDPESAPLEGLWEDIQLTDRDIEEAKKQALRKP
jgi:hypothetical protein